MKIGVVGAGFVGSASAYALVMQGICSEIILVDHNQDLVEAQAEDILHAVPFTHHVNVYAGDYEDLADSTVIVVAAGVNQKPSESRLDLLKRNSDIFHSIIPAIRKHAANAILIIATNPVDLMTQITLDIIEKENPKDISKIIGSGTILDTARFRSLLSQHLDISSHSVHGYVIGEHGDSEVLIWSGATVGNLDLEEFAAQRSTPVTDDVKTHIASEVKNAAYKIIKGKGATYYGIGAGIARIVNAVLDNEKAVITCSSTLNSYEFLPPISLSLPRIISSSGIETTMHPPLNTPEMEALIDSASILLDNYDKLKA